MNKPKISYREFLGFKDDYLRDLDPLKTFGNSFCDHFSVDSDRVRRTSTVVEARVAIDHVVEWIG